MNFGLLFYGNYLFPILAFGYAIPLISILLTVYKKAAPVFKQRRLIELPETPILQLI